MQATLTITAKTYPKCDDYLRIRKADDEYKKIEDFIKLYPNIKEPEIYECMIKYRAVEKTYREFMNDYLSFADQLQFVEFNSCKIIVNQSARVSKYFIEKAIDCLQTARFFAIKSHLILDRNFNCNQGEIDIIAKDKDEYVFIEVKTRANGNYGLPSEAVDKRKISNITKGIRKYIHIKNWENKFIRLDLIELFYKNKKFYINHIKQII